MAIQAGILDERDSGLVNQEHCGALRIVLEMMDLHQGGVPCESEMERYRSELAELNDMLDLEDCDRVEQNKSFSHGELGITIPDWFAPFLRRSLFPAIRQMLESDNH
jgi:hypothetical protein